MILIPQVLNEEAGDEASEASDDDRTSVFMKVFLSSKKGLLVKPFWRLFRYRQVTRYIHSLNQIFKFFARLLKYF